MDETFLREKINDLTILADHLASMNSITSDKDFSDTGKIFNDYARKKLSIIIGEIETLLQ